MVRHTVPRSGADYADYLAQQSALNRQRRAQETVSPRSDFAPYVSGANANDRTLTSGPPAIVISPPRRRPRPANEWATLAGGTGGRGGSGSGSAAPAPALVASTVPQSLPAWDDEAPIEPVELPQVQQEVTELVRRILALPPSKLGRLSDLVSELEHEVVAEAEEQLAAVSADLPHLAPAALSQAPLVSAALLAADEALESVDLDVDEGAVNLVDNDIGASVQLLQVLDASNDTLCLLETSPQAPQPQPELPSLPQQAPLCASMVIEAPHEDSTGDDFAALLDLPPPPALDSLPDPTATPPPPPPPRSARRMALRPSSRECSAEGCSRGPTPRRAPLPSLTVPNALPLHVSQTLSPLPPALPLSPAPAPAPAPAAAPAPAPAPAPATPAPPVQEVEVDMEMLSSECSSELLFAYSPTHSPAHPAPAAPTAAAPALSPPILAAAAPAAAPAVVDLAASFAMTAVDESVELVRAPAPVPSPPPRPRLCPLPPPLPPALLPAPNWVCDRLLYCIDCQELSLDLLTTWGDTSYVGLSHVLFYGPDGSLLDAEPDVFALPSGVGAVPGAENDGRVAHNLICGDPCSVDDSFMWLAPTASTLASIYDSQSFSRSEPDVAGVAALGSTCARITFSFPSLVSVSAVKIYGYNKPGNACRSPSALILRADGATVSGDSPWMLPRPPGLHSDFGQVFFLQAPVPEPTPRSRPPQPPSLQLVTAGNYSNPVGPSGAAVTVVLLSNHGHDEWCGLGGVDLYLSDHSLLALHPRPDTCPCGLTVADMAPPVRGAGRLSRITEAWCGVQTTGVISGGCSTSLVNVTERTTGLFFAVPAPQAEETDLNATWAGPAAASAADGAAEIGSVTLVLSIPVELSRIVLHHFAAVPSAGAREVQVYLDDALVCSCELGVYSETTPSTTLLLTHEPMVRTRCEASLPQPIEFETKLTNID